jgi:hypothetical protein
MNKTPWKKIVAAGYDQIADAYAERFSNSSVRDKKVAELVEAVPLGERSSRLGLRRWRLGRSQSRAGIVDFEEGPGHTHAPRVRRGA